MRYSVIVPLYNKVEYVRRTLESLFAQTFTDFEIVVIDDGSTDGSAELAEQIANQHSHCCIVRQDNAGVAAARNHGVELSQGEYVCFLDADDWWEPTFLEEMNRLVDACPDAGLFGTGYYIVKNGRRRVAPIGVGNQFEMGYFDYCQTYARSLCMPISSSSVAIPRQLFVATGGFREGLSLGEDFDLWIRIALKHRCALVNKPLANYFQDLPSQRRATRRLHNPESHMLWNLDYLAEEEQRNPDLKLLLDRLRASGLHRYYLSIQYHLAAVEQLQKVDWNHISSRTYRIYHSPLWWQRLSLGVRTSGSFIKNALSNVFR